MDENKEQVVVVEEGEKKKSFKKSNVATLVLQIIFAVLCGVVILFEILFTSGFATTGSVNAGEASGFAGALAAGLAEGLGKVAQLILMLFPTAFAILLVIPFILLMVFCKRPWIALAAFVAMAVCTIACWVSIKVIGDVPTETANALQFLPVLKLMTV